MEKINTEQLAVAIIGAVLAFKHKWDADKAVETLDRSTMTEEQQEATEGEIIPEELDEGDWWEQFAEFVEGRGLSEFVNPVTNPDIACFAALRKGEPSFTLRGQDKFASVLVKHWIALAEAFSENVSAGKLNGADRIVAAMESYPDQKFPD